ncbi:hypothetical protein IAI18_16605 [Acetobacteraceae bacterium H6797]|nr:hypothetical protein [Acetobacteraceae bacterium H6797]
MLMSSPAFAQNRAAPQQQQRPAAGPQRLGTFQSWTAATYQEGGQKVCYAFARASKSEGGGNRQNVMLIVTHRHNSRDQIALRAGYTYPRNAEVNVTIGTRELDFYTSGTDAFARDGGQAVAAFKAGRDVEAKGPAATGRGQVTDTFSLAGFSAAYDAISKECPPARGR